ncbi:MAG: S1 RNA-binding domain-containing protein [Planctomycetales bacterium]|nr:S1 RNA-binding domain-containing protein [Planctomycetales bacterium]NIM08895.1 S1 RNA-binding domain-containing protein [Planctomycetales bacterium]NIN08355.1 S1 RNA-binding domain-containing protein [Planctomycetales bacterium]NIN77483.1 S1 RNA-binding domain-containing protein [Planctomycetales bacterium]NIO34655.1 S1 RNA-binding domain-containing protein [Planctomycetales bacterium]
MTDDQPQQAGKPTEMPAVQPTDVEPAPAQGTDPPATVCAADKDCSPSADRGKTVDAGVRQKRTIKIGSQRDSDNSAAPLKAKPQNLDSSAAATVGQDTVGQDTVGQDTVGQDNLPLTTGEPSVSRKPNFPPPRLPAKLTPEMQEELEAAVGNIEMDELLAAAAPIEELEEGARVRAKIISAREDVVLVDLDRPHQGAISLKQFASPPEPGAIVEAIVSRFIPDEGMYELQIAGAAVDVARWEELDEGMIVDAVVTGHNKGGLECEVNKLRGFMPASQVALYPVQNLEEMVGQRFPCVVTEVKPERRNLVLSRRAVLERERTAAKQKLLEELEVGQTREGVVRRLQPFGAFVDLGGVDGLVHISQLSWDRISHPSEVLQEGQKIKVKISKIDPDTGKIGLAYRDTWENPWEKVPQKYKPKATVQGTITRLTDFGAFVRLEPGVEGLIHVSEIAHQRVWRASDVLSEGQEVDVMVLAVDAGQQRISLSLKALQTRPQKEDDPQNSNQIDPSASPQQAATTPPGRPKKKKQPQLRGGTNRASGGESFGLKW